MSSGTKSASSMCFSSVCSKPFITKDVRDSESKKTASQPPLCTMRLAMLVVR